MGIISTLFGVARQAAPERVEPRIVAASPENPSTSLANPAEWLNDWASGGYPQKFGPHVTERTAMAVSAVYRAVTLHSGLQAELPLKVWKRTSQGRDEASDHRLAPFFRMAPWPGRPLTSYIWREMWLINVLLWGNHYSIIRYDGAARVIGFEPVMPWNVQVLRVRERNVYRCNLWGNEIGLVDQDNRPTIEYIDQDDMIHIPGPGFNGIVGMSRIRAFARNAVSISALLEEQTGIVHENAARPSAYVTLPPKISKEGKDRFTSQFDNNYTGRRNAGRVIYGDQGTEFTPMQMSPEDLNTIASRQFQVADVSRFFGVPLHLLNETTGSTSWGSGLSEQTLAYLIYTLNPDLGRIEAELNYKLLNGTDFYIEFDRDAMMAMDPVKSAQVAQTEIASGTLLINERRRHKNRPPVPHGDEPLINAANVPLAKVFAPGAQPSQDPIGPKPGEQPAAEPKKDDPPEDDKPASE